MVMLARTAVVGVTSRMIRESSRIVVMNVSKNPETNPVLVSGKIIREKRCQALAPATAAASSNSRPTWSIAETPLRDEYGICFDTDTTTSNANVPYRGGIGPTDFVNIEM